jgi:hypothetical protein
MNSRITASLSTFVEWFTLSLQRALFPYFLMALVLFGDSHFSLAQQPSEDPVKNEQIDRSIDRALDYLSKNQRLDGSFEQQYGETAAIPALVGMAFLAKGHVPGEGRYGETINRALDYVLSCANRETYFGEKNQGKMYAHSIATLFISEVSGMVDIERQKKIDDLLPKAIKLILDAQAMKKQEQHQGGWRYSPNATDSDMSCSGWALMALRSCRLNGGPVPPEAIASAVEYVKRHSHKELGKFGYMGTDDHSLTLSGAGILCLELCGKHNDPASLKAAKYLMKNYQDLSKDNRCFYGMYYTSQGLFQIGGESWKTFSTWMYETFIPMQGSDGAWQKGEEGSKIYGTALCVLAFTVPYRQLPIYQRDETVDEKE